MIVLFIAAIIATILASVCSVMMFLYHTDRIAFKSEVSATFFASGFTIFPLVAGVIIGKVLTHL